jgi:hypothetical protein
VNIASVIQILVATGILTALSETVRWAFGRNKTKVDSALVIQGMAIDLLKPLHEELARADKAARSLRQQMNDLDREMELIISWALTARGLLESNHIPYPPMPKMEPRKF